MPYAHTMSTPPLLPSPVQYGKVVGQYVQTTLDSTDVDEIPDAAPITGTVTFTPLDGQGHVVDGIFVFFRTLVVPLDPNTGRIITRSGQDGVWLPTGNYRVTFAFAGVTAPSTDILVTTAHTALAPMNLPVEMPPVGPVLTPSQYFELSTQVDSIDGRLTTLETSGGVSVPDATSGVKGIIRLAGDLAGTATTPTVPGLATKANISHTHVAIDVTDSTATGRSLLTAADAATARAAIGAGTSNLALGTTGTTAAAGNHTHAAADIVSGTVNSARLGGGTADGTTFLRGDGTWAVPPSGGVDATAVHLAGAETVTGAKTFTGGLTISTTNLTITDKDIVLSTTTGTKIGTGTGQKIGFFNATPVAQQGATTDLGLVLSNLGLRQGGNYAISTSGTADLSGTVNLTGATTFGSSITTKGTNQSVGSLTLGAHHKVLCNTSGGTVNITLPTAIGVAGREYVISKITNDANTVVITAAGGQLNGQTSRTLTRRWESVTFTSDGTNWVIIGQGEPLVAPTYPIGSSIYSNPLGKGTAAAVSDTKSPCTPLPVPRSMQINELRIRQQVSADGGNMHIALYASDASGKPTGSPLYTTTAIAANGGAGTKSWTGLSWNLAPGLYWLAFGSYGYTTTKALPATFADTNLAHPYIPLTSDPTWTPGFRLTDYNDATGTWPSGAINTSDLNAESAWWYNIRGVLA